MEDDDRPSGHDPQHSVQQKQTRPDFVSVIEDLQGGTVEALLTRLMADCAMGTAAVGEPRRKGKLVLTLQFSATHEGMLDVEHSVEFKHPTQKGWKAEQVGDVQPMFVNAAGALTIAPDNQRTFTFD